MNPIILKLVSILNFGHFSSLQALLNLLSRNELLSKTPEVIENSRFNCITIRYYKRYLSKTNPKTKSIVKITARVLKYRSIKDWIPDPKV